MKVVKDRDIVIPGQPLGEDIKYGENCFYEQNKVYSSVCGLARVNEKQVGIIPSAGRYTPKVNDVIIGVVNYIFPGRWRVDMNSPYQAIMPGEAVSRNPLHEDLKKYFKIGDIISAMVVEVDEVYQSVLTRPWRLEGGFIMTINPKRIPRVIGKQRSMLNMIREKTGNKIVVGQNGRIWIKGENVEFISKIIKKIEAEAQTKGLTNKISGLLDGDAK